jgi:hypothetical protein
LSFVFQGIVTSDASGAINADVQFDLLQLIPGVAPNAYSIIGRAVMIHNMTDDGVTAGTGNAGARFAIGVIGISNRPMPPPAAGGSSSTGTSGGNIPDQTPPKAGTPTGATLCDRLTTALGQQVTAAGTANALSTYVQKAFYGWTNQVGLYNSPITGGYFNGQLQYRYAGDPSSIILARAFAADGSNLVSPDFNADSVQLNALVNSLTNFFGQKEVLDCTAAPATYTGSNNMYAVHQRMNITQGVFSAFNDILVQTAGAYGLTADDAAALLAGLNSFGRNGATMTNEICTDSKCACATGYDGDACDHSTLGAASSVVVSIASLMIAAVVATVAQQL